jgi:hypothetical protein
MAKLSTDYWDDLYWRELEQKQESQAKRRYYNSITMRELFMNDDLKNVLPQVDKDIGTRGYIVYSTKERQNKITQYIKTVLRGVMYDDNTIVCKGNHKTVIKRVRQLQTVLEQLYDSMPSVTKNLRSNTPLYLPYANINELLAKCKSRVQKTKLIQEIVDNINYNPAFRSINTVQNNTAVPFYDRQSKWEIKVGI